MSASKIEISAEQLKKDNELFAKVNNQGWAHNKSLDQVLDEALKAKGSPQTWK